jgi:hypothetical protein
MKDIRREVERNTGRPEQMPQPVAESALQPGG